VKAAIAAFSSRSATSTLATFKYSSGMACYDGSTTHQMSLNGHFNDNSSGTVTASTSNRTDDSEFLKSSNATPKASLTSWLSNGVQVTWNPAATAAWYFSTLLLGGDIQANIVHAQLDSDTSTTISHGLSAAPEIIIAMTELAITPPDGTGTLIIGFWAGSSSTQAGIGMDYPLTGDTVPGVVAQRVESASMIVKVSNTGPATTFVGTVANVGSTTFDLTTTANAFGYVSFLCLRGTTTPLVGKAGVYTTPASTGNASMSLGLSVAPSVLLMVPSRQTTTGSLASDDTAGAIGFYVGANRSSSASSVYGGKTAQIDVGADPTAADRKYDTTRFSTLTTAGADSVVATLNAWQSDDIQLNFSNVGGGQQKWVYLAFGAADSAISITSFPSEIANGLQVTVIGTGFGASQGTGNVYLSPTDSIADADKVTQSIVSWSDTSITFTVTRGSLLYNTNLYLFVKENGGTSNASGSVTQIKPGVTLVWEV